MRTVIRCPLQCPMRPVKKPGDGLIRHWLSLQGWKVGYVHSGVIYLPSLLHAEWIEQMLTVRWFPEAPMPQVGIYYEV
jgi:hypothetical protein